MNVKGTLSGLGYATGITAIAVGLMIPGPGWAFAAGTAATMAAGGVA